MAQAKYAFQGYNQGMMARAIGRDLDVSPKQAIEICNRLRRKSLTRAKQILQDAITMRKPIEFTRFTNGLGHKPGHMAAGRYPIKASQTILALLESAEVNAQSKGLNTSNLAIIHLCAHRANEPFHPGRQRRSQMKRAHIEVVMQEAAPAAGEAASTKKERKKNDKNDKKHQQKKETFNPHANTGGSEQ
ncbi:50S ribosomal protein L22 [Candidatus Woesearchaeota archaeon]|nr:50S ribosomal protein L22 [Candidatus Woesearchaeota archaeon]